MIHWLCSQPFNWGPRRAIASTIFQCRHHRVYMSRAGGARLPAQHPAGADDRAGPAPIVAHNQTQGRASSANRSWVSASRVAASGARVLFVVARSGAPLASRPQPSESRVTSGAPVLARSGPWWPEVGMSRRDVVKRRCVARGRECECEWRKCMQLVEHANTIGRRGHLIYWHRLIWPL